MVTRRAKVVGVAAGALALLLAVGLWWSSRLDFFAWDAPRPGSIVAETMAPDSGLVATVKAGLTKGEYLFELRRTDGGELVASERISAPVGYHPHRITLRWLAGGARVVATIDHDFGDGNLEFPLAPKPPN
jgi:hypothetical protein